MSNFLLRSSLFILLALSSCSGREKKPVQVFRYNESKGIASLDPAFARNQSIIWPVNQLYNGLLQMDSRLNIRPCIAKGYEISDDGLSYTFFLRTDVYFHPHSLFSEVRDRKVVAADFVYSFNRLIDPSLASPGKWIMNNVDRIGDGLNCRALNDSVLQIKLKSPFPAFLGLLTMQYCSVVPKEVVEHYGDDFRKNPIGTGPFKLKIWVEGEKLVLSKYEKYFEKDSLNVRLPYLEGIAISFIADKQSEFLEFLSGNIDFISGVNSAYKDEILTKGGTLREAYADKLNLLKGSYLNTEYLGFLLDKERLHNKALSELRVRQAINYGFDRKKMMIYLRNNIGIPATGGIVPTGMPGFELSVAGFDYNPSKARKLLEEAGYPSGEGMEPIQLITTSDYLDLCEFIQFQLSELGLKIKIEVSSGGAFRELVANSRVDFFRASWVADYPDPENYLSLFYSKNSSPGGPNYTQFSSSYFDELYEKAMNEVDQKKRMLLYREMDQFIIDQAPVVPLFYDEVIRLCQKNIQHFETNPMNLLILKNVKK